MPIETVRGGAWPPSQTVCWTPVEDLLGDVRDVRCARPVQHHTELIVADAADDIARPQALVECAAGRDDRPVGDIVTVGVVDKSQIIDRDQEIGARHVVTRGVGQGALQCLAQPRPIVLPGQFVVVDQTDQTVLALLAHPDAAHGADDPNRFARLFEFGHAAIMNPAVLAVFALGPVFAFKAALAAQLAFLQIGQYRTIFPVEAREVSIAQTDVVDVVDAEDLDRILGPGDLTAGNIPIVDRVA